MLLLDVNVVLAAHRGDHPHHEIVRARFHRVLADDRPFTVPTVVWASFFRLATNRRIFRTPTPLPDAIAFMRAVLGQPNHLLTTPGHRHLDLLADVMERSRATGDLVPDAVLAALAGELDAEVLTLDRDFLRFEDLRVELIRV